MQKETASGKEHLYPDPEYMFTVQSELTRCTIDEKGIDGMLAYLSGLFGCAVVLENPGFSILSASVPAAYGTDGYALKPYLSATTSRSFNNPESFIRSLSQSVAIIDAYESLIVYRLVTVVSSRRECLSVLSLVRTDEPFSEMEHPVIRLASDFFAMQLASDRRVAEIELKLTGNVIEDLIFAHSPDYAPIISRAKALNYDIAQPHRVLVAKPDSFEQTAKRLNMDLEKLGSELAKTIQDILVQANDGLVVFRIDELIIFFRQKSGGDSFDAVNEFAEKTIKTAELSFKLKLYIGIGNICSGPEEYKSSYLAAKKALEIGEFMITEGQIRSFEKFKIHALFLSTIKPDELIEYARSQVGELLEYDITHKSELIKTLQEFLYLRNNIEGTAKSLSMSVSGLKYRLKRIERILGRDLKDNKVSFDLQLALIILQLFGEYRI